LISAATFLESTLGREHVGTSIAYRPKNVLVVSKVAVQMINMLKINYLTFVQATGVRLGMIVQALATIVVGLIIAFIYSWKFALFVFGVMPFMLLGAVMQIRLAKGFSMKNMAKLVEAGKVRIQ
jgi:ABC-type multidrug transport system fused ATPase/permease subunit